MSTRPEPDHGTRARYLRGCRCTPCTDAAYHYMSRIRLDHERGQRRRIPAGNIRDHVKSLAAAGWTLTKIATAAGCSRHTISDLATHATRHVRRDIGTAILAIPITRTPTGLSRDVDATGTVRRLRALVAIGWPLATVAPAAGLHRDQIARISRGGEPQVRATTANAIATVYRTWCTQPGPSNRARTVAARRGWHGPLAWDDIDDPAAEPEVDTTCQGSRAVALVEDWEWLERQGYSREHAAERLGIHPQTLQAAISRTRRARIQNDMETAA